MIVFERGKDVFVTRVIGLPGDKVGFEDDKVYVNGQCAKQQKDTYPFYSETLYGKSYQINLRENNPKNGYPDNEVTVEEKSFYVLGDERHNAVDSRNFGFVKEHDIKYQVKYIVYSFGVEGRFNDGNSKHIIYSRIGTKI